MLSTTTGNIVKTAKNALLNALFPIFCLKCRKDGFWLCQECLSRTKILDLQVCPSCERSITDGGFLCPVCKQEKRSNLDCLVCAVSYEEPAVKKLVHNLKYRFVSGIADPLACLITKALIRNDFPIPDYIAPVPLHPRRLRWRGFNQSLLIAEKISEELVPLVNIEISDILERTKYNSPQMEIKNYKERLQNVQNIFGTKPGADCEKLRGKTILLVDDIATTGATLEECAGVLKTAGARKVYAAVVARQTLKK